MQFRDYSIKEVSRKITQEMEPVAFYLKSKQENELNEEILAYIFLTNVLRYEDFAVMLLYRYHITPVTVKGPLLGDGSISQLRRWF